METSITLAYLMAIALNFGPTGVFLAIVLAEVLISVMAIIWFRKGRWKTIMV